MVEGMARAAGRAIGRQPRSVAIPRNFIGAIAAFNGLRQRLGGATQILTAGKVGEMFHPDWTIHDRRLAEATGFVARYDLEAGFADTVAWYRRRHWL